MNRAEFEVRKESGENFKVEGKAYHITYKKNLDSILENGLLCEGIEKVNDWADDAVFMNSSHGGGLAFALFAYEDYKIYGELVEIEVDLSELDTALLEVSYENFDESDDETEWVYRGNISADAIKQVEVGARFVDNDEMNKLFGLA